LTLREIQRAGLVCAGVIMNVTRPADAKLVDDNKDEIQRIGGAKVIAVMPHFTDDPEPDAPRLPLVARAVAALVKQVNVRTLLGKEGSALSARSGLRPAVH